VSGQEGADRKDRCGIARCAKPIRGLTAARPGHGQRRSARFPPGQKPYGVAKAIPRDRGRVRRIPPDRLSPAAIKAASARSCCLQYWNGVTVLGQQVPLDRDPEGRARIRGLLHLRLQRHRPRSARDFRTNIKISINAGQDMVMVRRSTREFYGEMKGNGREGTMVPMTRIDGLGGTGILRRKGGHGPLEGALRLTAD